MYTLNAFFNAWTSWEVSESVSNVIEWRLLEKSFDQA